MRKILLLISLSLFGCASKGQSVKSKMYGLTLKSLLAHSVPEVSVESTNGMLDSYDVILDTRAKSEYDVSHIRGAYFISYDNFEIEKLSKINKDSKVLIYCSVGYRSEKIAEKMKEAGYTDVANLYGGIFEWKNQGHEVVDSSGNPTERVHAFDKTWGRFLKQGEKVY